MRLCGIFAVAVVGLCVVVLNCSPPAYLRIEDFESVLSQLNGEATRIRRSGKETTPLDFNAKIGQRMRDDRRPFWPALTDKWGVKLWAARRGVKVPSTIYHATKCDALPSLKSLPRHFVMKATHTSGCNMVVGNGVVRAQSECTIPGWLNPLGIYYFEKHERQLHGETVTDRLLLDACQRWLSAQYVSADTEWAYSLLQPAVIIEEAITTAHELACDIKCYTFHGTTEYMQHTTQRFHGDAKRDTFYERGTHWTAVNATFSSSHWEEDPSRRLPQEVLQNAASVCDRVGKGLDFARIDLLYTGDQGMLLGEVTAYPMGGNVHFRGEPDLNMRMGLLWY